MKKTKDKYVNTYETINRILTAVENDFKGSRRLKVEQIGTLLDDLNDLMIVYSDIDTEMCLQTAKKRYVPLLNLMMRIDKNDTRRVRYLKYLENIYCHLAKRDFGYFLLYYEWDNKDKIYEKRYSVLHPYVYYLNEMAFNPNFKMIIANLPSGWGKTRVAKLYEAWRLGVEPSGCFLSLCSNDTVVKGGSRSVIDIIKSERFGDMFPHLDFRKYGKDLFLKETDGEWKLKDCNLLATYYASTTNSNVVGQRASLSIEIDDLYADYKEALDENLNLYYYNKFVTVWRERFVQNRKPQIVISGTMWSPTDFIVKVIDLMETENEFVPHERFKYTRVSKDGSIAIIQVPALDPDTLESSCPELISTEELLKKKNSMDTYLWETNFQQNPTTPEGLDFDWKNLKLYDNTPKNEYGYSYAVIDGTRKSGKDFFSMPIFQDFNDNYALIDCIFTKTATTDLIEDILDKIETHHIVKLVIETNVDGGLKRTLDEKLRQRGISYCIIIEKYNTVPKAIRIEAEKGNIVRKLWFPAKVLLQANSDIAKFMNNFTLYNSVGRNKNDDAPDSNAMFTSEIIGEKSKVRKATAIKRPF